MMILTKTNAIAQGMTILLHKLLVLSILYQRKHNEAL